MLSVKHAILAVQQIKCIMIQFYRKTKEKSLKAYYRECSTDRRLFVLGAIANLLQVGVLIYAGVSGIPLALICVLPIAFLAKGVAKRIKKSIKNQYLYL